ncbi:MAG: hypothetical protein PHV82_18550, partial [Victivallaceae bacterium]|nr:hypothetical protein [Victivallaceae bacterium]
MSLSFEEPKGELAKDGSSYGNDGYIHGCKRSRGKSGSALEFDGIDDFVRVPNAQSLNCPEAITVMGWIYPAQGHEGMYPRILTKEGVLTVDINSNTRLFRILLAIKDKLRCLYPAPAPTDAWTHFAFTFDGRERKFYIDGVKCRIQGKNWYKGTAGVNAQDIYIGNTKSGKRGFKGIIDEIKIYSRALSEEEIADEVDRVSPRKDAAGKTDKAGGALQAAKVKDNLAFGRPCVFSRVPDYFHTADSRDKNQLTDGIYSREDIFSAQKSTVGWEGAPDDPVYIKIDLAAGKSLGEIRISTFGNAAEKIFPPRVIQILVSNDNRNYYLVDEMKGSRSGGKKKKIKLSSAPLNVSGRYVIIYIVPDGKYFFCDEIEIIGTQTKTSPGNVADFQAVPFSKIKESINPHAVNLLEKKLQIVEKNVHKVAIPGRKKDIESKLRKIRDEFKTVKQKSPLTIINGGILSALEKKLSFVNMETAGILFADKLSSGYILWYKNRWENFQPYCLPAAGSGDLRELNVGMCGNECHSTAFMISNLRAEDLLVRITADAFAGAAKRKPA